MNQPLYQRLALLVVARNNCIERNNLDWKDRHEENLLALVERYMPSGSGVDNGTHIDLEESSRNRLVFTFGFHHMNENGYYDGWTEHKAIVTPSLQFGFHLRITGRDRNEIKEYLYGLFNCILRQSVEI